MDTDAKPAENGWVTQESKNTIIQFVDEKKMSKIFTIKTIETFFYKYVFYNSEFHLNLRV